MRRTTILLCLGAILFSFACSPKPQGFIVQKLEGKSEIVDKVLSDPQSFIPQIIYTQIDRDSMGKPHFISHHFRTDDSTYFYPASTVKMPVAFLAFEKLKQLGIEDLNERTAMYTDSAYSGQSPVRVDSTAENMLPSVGHYAKKIFIVSDNDAFNRLYEFVGQEAINDRFEGMGYRNTRISHRLSIFLSEEENRHTNPIRFEQNGRLIYQQSMQVSQKKYSHPFEVKLGKGELIGDSVTMEPKDFSKKNFVPLTHLHDMLKAVIFPGDVPASQRFDLKESDYPILYQYLSEFPAESSYPSYDTSYYYDGYVKFFMYGDTKEPIPSHIRIFNKVGYAYGFLTDVAYIVDFENKIEFFLAATVHVNANQIYNDGNYEYDDIGIPYLAEIGRIFYEFESQREREFAPDLSRFKVAYD